MHQLREMPEDMSDGGRGKQKRPQSQECHGVHPLSEVYESLSDQGFVNLRLIERTFSFLFYILLPYGFR